MGIARRSRLAAVAAAASLALAACATTDDDGAPADPPAEDASDASDASADEGVGPLAGDPTTERQEEAGTAGTLAVADVRIGQHDGFDRVVFDLEGDGRPGGSPSTWTRRSNRAEVRPSRSRVTRPCRSSSVT